LVSRGDEISILHVGANKGVMAIFEKVPDLMEKIIEMRQKKKEEDKKEK